MTPPPVSAAVPVSVTFDPSATDAGGLVIVDVGAVVSVDGDARTRPVASAPGWAPMSAKRFTVAWRMFGSDVPCEFHVFRPHAHCTVPAPNTSAPLGARYIVRVCVAVELNFVVLPSSVKTSTPLTVVEDRSTAPLGR